jgi:hypothetical protein
MVETLCALGAEARKNHKPLDAASDWNRALANAPDDPKLLRLVAGMNRAEARSRILRQAAKVALLSAVLGVAAFYVGKLLQAGPHTVAGTASTTASAPPPPSSLLVTSASAPPPEPSRLPTISSAVVALPRPDHAADAGAPKIVDRTVTLDLTPPYAVRLSVDDAAEIAVQTGQAITLSSKAHLLAFTCPVCTPVVRQLAAGDKDDELRVVLPVRPATLIIDGPPDTYKLDERPTLNLRVGANNVTVGNGGSVENVTVVQLETSTRVHVKLEAGKEVHAQF